MPFVFAAMGVFSTNDVHDIEKDRESKGHRLLPRGIISAKAALIVSRIMMALSVVAVIFSVSTVSESMVYSVAIIGAITYNCMLKWKPILSTMNKRIAIMGLWIPIVLAIGIIF